MQKRTAQNKRASTGRPGTVRDGSKSRRLTEEVPTDRARFRTASEPRASARAESPQTLGPTIADGDTDHSVRPPRGRLLQARPRSKRPSRRLPPEVLTNTEVCTLMQACSRYTPTGLRNRALIALLYRSGLRINEALCLYPKDLDLADGSVRVLHGKGGRSRTVGLDPGAAAVIERWLDARSQTYHSLEAVDRYLGQFDRVRHCRRESMGPEAIALTLNCSPALVQEYLKIDDQLEARHD